MRTAIIVGAAGAIGRATAEAMQKEGWACVLVDISDAVHEVASELGADAHVFNVTESQQVAALLEVAPLAEALVNCVGIARLAPVLETSEEQWRQIIDVNLTGAFLLNQAMARAMVANGGGSIVNVASISGMRAGVGRVAYGSSKAGLIHMTKQFAIELAHLGVRCNSVAPGPVASPMAESAHPTSQVQDYLKSIPQGRYATPAEIAHSIAFLCSDNARHITGECLVVDGGWLSAGVGLDGLK